MHDELRIQLDRLDRVTVSLARAEIYRAIDRADGDIHLDLGDMEWVDRIGLALLAAAHERSHRRGHHLVVHCNSPALRRRLAVTRLARVLHLAPA
jgi:anti-anti-sigma factor